MCAFSFVCWYLWRDVHALWRLCGSEDNLNLFRHLSWSFHLARDSFSLLPQQPSRMPLNFWNSLLSTSHFIVLLWNYRCLCDQVLAFTWVLGIWTQVVRRVLFPSTFTQWVIFLALDTFLKQKFVWICFFWELIFIYYCCCYCMWFWRLNPRLSRYWASAQFLRSTLVLSCL